MNINSDRNDKASEKLSDLSEQRDTLSKEAFERRDQSTFAGVFGERIEVQPGRLNVELREIEKGCAPRTDEVEELLKERFLTINDYRKYIPNLQIDLKPMAPLPIDILAILRQESPLHGSGELVKDTHLLAWIPDDVSLKELTQAVLHRRAKVLYGGWLMKDNDPVGELKLSDIGQEGHWALIPNTLQIETRVNNPEESIAALNSNYVQADVISFSMALILHAVKNDILLCDYGWGWFKDPRDGKSTENDNAFSSNHSRALTAGCIDKFGLITFHKSPYIGNVSACFGCAAVWNFNT